jgi:hypothetical protein
MNEPKQKLIDQQMLALLDSLRKSGALNMGESNWYNARRGAMGGLEVAAARSASTTQMADADQSADSGAVAVADNVVAPAARALSRLERKTIEKILSSHGIATPAGQA